MRIALLSALAVLLPLAAPAARAEVESRVVKSLSLEGKPLDAALSPDGTRLFVLVGGKSVHIYSPGGTLQGTLDLENPADGIELSRSGDILYLRSTERQAVDIVRLDFVQQITVGTSPVKGSADAPVVVAVFTDFQ